MDSPLLIPDNKLSLSEDFPGQDGTDINNVRPNEISQPLILKAQENQDAASLDKPYVRVQLPSEGIYVDRVRLFNPNEDTNVKDVVILVKKPSIDTYDQYTLTPDAEGNVKLPPETVAEEIVVVLNTPKDDTKPYKLKLELIACFEVPLSTTGSSVVSSTTGSTATTSGTTSGTEATTGTTSGPTGTTSTTPGKTTTVTQETTSSGTTIKTTTVEGKNRSN